MQTCAREKRLRPQGQMVQSHAVLRTPTIKTTPCKFSPKQRLYFLACLIRTKQRPGGRTATGARRGSRGPKETASFQLRKPPLRHPPQRSAKRLGAARPRRPPAPRTPTAQPRGSPAAAPIPADSLRSAPLTQRGLIRPLRGSEAAEAALLAPGPEGPLEGAWTREAHLGPTAPQAAAWGSGCWGGGGSGHSHTLQVSKVSYVSTGRAIVGMNTEELLANGLG